MIDEKKRIEFKTYNEVSQELLNCNYRDLEKSKITSKNLETAQKVFSRAMEEPENGYLSSNLNLRIFDFSGIH